MPIEAEVNPDLTNANELVFNEVTSVDEIKKKEPVYFFRETIKLHMSIQKIPEKVVEVNSIYFLKNLPGQVPIPHDLEGKLLTIICIMLKFLFRCKDLLNLAHRPQKLIMRLLCI